MADVERFSVVRKVANALRGECLAHEEGELMGSEEELFRRYRVSRPTFRQAAALLAQEQLLIIKRGVGGGYFASRPAPDAVAHMTAIYLQTKHTQVDEIFLAIAPLRLELSRLAARCDDEEARAELAAFLDAERTAEFKHLPKNIFDVGEYRQFLKSEREFGRILGRMADNKVLSLFLEMLYEFFAMIPKEDDVYRRKLVRTEIYRDLRMRIIEAILDRDEQLTALRSARCGAALDEWLTEDKAQRPARKRTGALILTPPEPPVQPRAKAKQVRTS